MRGVKFIMLSLKAVSSLPLQKLTTPFPPRPAPKKFFNPLPFHKIFEMHYPPDSVG